MPQDAFTLRYLCLEFDEIFKGGKVNRITQPSNDEIIFTIYTGKKTEKLLLSVNPASPRMGMVKADKESPLTAPNFCMLMRKHLLSATVLGVSLVGFDRIVKIDFLSSGEFFDSIKKTLYVELMGRYSNIILTENGKVLGGNRGINMFDDGVRPLIVGRPYVFPPVGDKKLPEDKSLIECFNGVKDCEIASKICQNVQGVAQSTAQEIASDFLSKNATLFGLERAEKLFEFLNQFLYNTQKNPCVIYDQNMVKDVCVFPYKSVVGEKEFYEYLYLAEDDYFTQKDNHKKFLSKRERLNAIINTAIKKCKKKLTAITAKERDALTCEENKLKGELLLSNIYRLKDGQAECEVDNYYDGTTLKIVLDSRLSIAKNAENFYKRYNKQKRTLTALKPQREQAESELNYYLSVLDELVLSEEFDDLLLVEKELENAGLIAPNKVTDTKKKNETFCREYFIDNFVVRAGRNNAENDKLTFTAHPEDVWVHAKDYHSSHVVISACGKVVPEKVILIACEICAYYSKGRDGGKTEIVYALKKHVKKPPKSKPGFCVYDNFKSVMVTPEKRAEFFKTI